MPKKKIFITREVPELAVKMLKKYKDFNVTMYKGDKKIPRKVLLQKVKGCSGILSLLSEKMDAKVMDAAGPNLKVIANYAVGYDNVDLAAAKERKIKVGNTPCNEVSESVAEFTFSLLMSLSRRIVEADKYTRLGKYEEWKPMLMLGRDVYNKTIGVVGLGRIGQQVCRRAAKGFGMRVLYTDMRRNPQFEKEYKARKVSLNTLLKNADYVSLHVPLLPATHHLISTKQLKMMKKSAYLINTARGPVVHEKALLKALYANQIAGAALDVFECEPAIDCDTSDRYELRKLDNVIITPHTASATIEARDAMARLAAGNIIGVLKGKRAPTLVKIK
ncbi:D-glycerate dehydrogenase [Candidatus Saccharibacteria bacterium]|nr:D-glycerate dehydrogenase [Candidatus Saccharibacteria bacterium]NIV04516.1 D-glycerate dehydrogenase [Calditrichia bacterium]NIS39065.1 D-glycerate dehydrogenase [Candidatus Saccharibacteria bacterium]NIV73113.1 D-glycerate dehydrogenase [Calditrichia bacterium]NIV99485.1 D-glycerate dehydrogenase [Candidatus Saccharibacteria bacterium]